MLRPIVHFCFSIVSLVFLSLPAAGQQTSRNSSMLRTVHGQVRFARGGNPAEHVIVRLERFHGGVWGEVVTDATGTYQFSGMAPDMYMVTVRFPGYLEQRREVDLQSMNNAYELFQLVADRSSSIVNSVPTAKVINANVPAEAAREFERGEAALARGSGATNLQDAVRHWETAVGIYPAFLEAHLRLGTAYMDLKQWDKAEATLRRVIEIDSKTANAWFALGELYLQQKRIDDAEKALREGLAVENRSWQGHFALGRLYLGKGETVKAARQIALTIQLNPNLADAHLLAGNIFLHAGNREYALAEYRDYLRLAPNGEYAAQARETLKKLRPSP